MPNKVFLYSIQHTGTHFIRDLILKSSDNDLKTDKPYELNIRTKDGDLIRAFDRENRTPRQYIRTIESLVDIKGASKESIALFFCHHVEPKSKMMKNLKTRKPPIPYVAPMRDPLLAINTYMFWDKAFGISKEDRSIYVNKIINRFISLLSVPKEHMMLLPVDIYNKKTTGEKIDKVKELYEFCGLQWNDKVSNFITNWKPIHQTKEIRKSISEQSNFMKNKNAITNRNIDYIEESMDVELRELRKSKELIEKLQDIGYEDLVWL